ncbi:alpha/beta hydrolase fold domain-containing protein [Streptococcus cameli]
MTVKPLCPPEIKPRYEDVPFAEVFLDNGEPYTLKMDIYQNPNQTEPGPTIVYIFGGGFLWGEYKQVTQKAVYCRDLVRLTKEGYTIISADYRLASQSIFPACIHDVKGLIRFLKANGPQFLIDPERIGVLGNSAGGHLAAMLALSSNCEELEGEVGGNLDQSSSVKVATVFYGVSDLLDTLADSAQSPLKTQKLAGTEIETIGNEQAALIPAIIVGYTGEGRTLTDLHRVLLTGDCQHKDWSYIELLRKCSPISYAQSSCPPILLLHGGQDVIVNPSQSRKLYDALVACGADATLINVSGAGHGPSLGAAVDQFAYQFLKDRL